MKFGIIKERKSTVESSLVFTPSELLRLKQLYQGFSVKVESCDNRAFSDDEYKKVGIEVADDISDCDVFFASNDLPTEDLIPNKTYFVVSHNFKKELHNRKLLQDLLEKNIDFYDFETIVNEYNSKVLGFGKYAGIVGAYNSFRAFGIKFELFKLPKVTSLSGKDDMIAHLKRLVLPPIKIVNTGTGIVGSGVKEILNAIKIKEVSIENYLSKNYTQPVYTQIDVLDYNIRKDGQVLEVSDFYQNPTDYVSNFERFTKVSDIYITGHFHNDEAPDILTRNMLVAKDCKIKVVADISCDLDNSIACTLRPSTVEEPIYGYLPIHNKEVEVFHPAAIVVVAGNNLPLDLAIEDSEGFGVMLMEYVIPAFFNNDKDGVLQRAKITENGKITTRFSYLQDDVDGK